MNYFDCHADTLTQIKSPYNLFENNCNLDIKRVNDFVKRYVQVFALWNDKSTTIAHQEAEFMNIYNRLRAFLKEQEDKISLCQSGKEMDEALENNRFAAFLAIEDISIMGCHVEQIRELGFSIAMLTWNYENQYASGAAYNQQKGLTCCGKELTEQLLHQGVVLDISHLSDTGVEDILTLTNHPIIASHSNVRAICGNPRNLTDNQIKEIIRRKGLIGMNFYAPFIGTDEKVEMNELIRHMDYILNLGGEDVLAIGSDFDGCSNKFPVGITGVQSIPCLKDEMQKAGFGAAIIEKIFFDNAYQFFCEI